MLDLLQKFLESAYPLKPDVMDKLLSIWQPYECKRKTILTSAGETEKHLYFVIEGIQRGYFIGEGKQEATIVFTYPPSFSGIADSFLTQTPSRYFLETLTASKFLRTNYRQIHELMQQYPEIQAMILQLTAYALKGVLERQIELQCYSAEEKFRTLLKRSPHVLQMIPHKYLASYLGIDATTFSKLLGSVRFSE